MIRFAQMAPSWKNSQTGRYYVVMSPEMLEKVKKDCFRNLTRKTVQMHQYLLLRLL